MISNGLLVFIEMYIQDIGATHYVSTAMLRFALKNAATKEELIVHRSMIDNHENPHQLNDEMMFIRDSMIDKDTAIGYFTIATPLLSSYNTHPNNYEVVTMLAMGVRNFSKRGGRMCFLPISVMIHKKKSAPPHREHATMIQNAIDRILLEDKEMDNRVVTCFVSEDSDSFNAYEQLSICSESAVHLKCDMSLKRKLMSKQFISNDRRLMFGDSIRDWHHGLLMSMSFDQMVETLHKMKFSEENAKWIHEEVENVFNYHSLYSKIYGGVVAVMYTNEIVDALLAILKMKADKEDSFDYILKLVEFNRGWYKEAIRSATIGSDSIHCAKPIFNYDSLAIHEKEKALKELGLIDNSH